MNHITQNENLSRLYQEEETAYTNADYERAQKIRSKIQKVLKQNNFDI